MDIMGMLAAPFGDQSISGVYLTVSVVVMLVVILVMYKTYRASLNVEARLAEFSSLSDSPFANRLKIIETNADEYRINKRALGPLAKIIDEYCVFTTDIEGRITYANDKFLALSGYAIQELIGRHQSVTQARENDSTLRDLSEDKVWHGELSNRTRAGQTYWVDVFVFPLSYLSEAERGYIYFGTDITAIKKLNSQLLNEVRRKEEAINKVENMLLHSEKMASLGVISTGIAHEINTPLAFVSSNIRQLSENTRTLARALTLARRIIGQDALGAALQQQDHAIQPSELAHALEDLPQLVQETGEGLERIQKIVSDLKFFAHVGSDSFQPVDLHRCIESALRLARYETRRGIEVVRHFEQSDVRVLGSEPQLSQVFVNLIINAAQALNGKGRITITTRINLQSFSIRVADNGPGIHADALDNIFEPFFTTKGLGTGTGLGLAISQDIIKRHKGNISVASTPNVGTTFLIHLPLVRNPAPQEPPHVC